MTEDQEKLFLQYQRTMTRKAMQYVHNIHDAEDIVSNSWLSLFQHLPTLLQLDQNALNAYVMRCVANKAIDYLRRQKRETACETLIFEQTLICSEKDDVPLLARELLESMFTVLTEQQRQILVLKLQGCSNCEIAQALHVKQATVRSSWYQIKKRIRRKVVG